MFLSEEEINEILNRVSIKDVIGSVVDLEQHGNMWIGLCPFHNESSPSLVVDEKRQIYYCFGCGHGGNVISFLMDYKGISFIEAAMVVGKEEKNCEKVILERENLLEMNKVASKMYQENLLTSVEAGEYIKARGLSDETIKKFGIGFSMPKGKILYNELKKSGFSDTDIEKSGLVGFYENSFIQDKFSNRLMFPIRNINGYVIGFGGRILEEKKKDKEKLNPKYINSQETLVFDKSGNLFGMDFAKGSKRDYFILCEGYMDVISQHQAGFTNAIASLGTALTEKQAELIKKYKNKVYVAYDSDGPGIKAAKRAIPILSGCGISIKFIDLKPYKDPDEFIKSLGNEKYQERLDRALTLEEWLFKQAYLSKDIKLMGELEKVIR